LSEAAVHIPGPLPEALPGRRDDAPREPRTPSHTDAEAAAVGPEADAAHVAHSLVAHHFDDIGQQRDAARLGMWSFLVTEVLFFGGLFAAYAVYRGSYPDAFAAGSKMLDVTLGTLNTIVLLASSLTMAMAVHAAETGRGPRAGRVTAAWLGATMLLGAAFLGVKGYEYYEKYREALIPGPYFVVPAGHAEAAHAGATEASRRHSQDAPPSAPRTALAGRPTELFFSLYFCMTGLHALHMIVGFGLLAVLATMALRGRFSPEYAMPVELGGLYWHFVDIVWVFLFPMLYLIDRHV
jgi:cytochrome c oxidase subunit 3